MGFFEKILGKQIDLGEQMPIYFVSSDEDYMQRAFEQARESFRYFWRELYWERRRIVPGLDYAMVKICFLDTINGEEVGEHMWINDVEFDGETIYGTLVNEPDTVQNVKVGDQVGVKKSPITYTFRVLQAIEKRVGAKLLPEVFENITPPEQYELLEMNRISGFIDRARGTGRPTKKDRRALDDFADTPIFLDEDFDLD